ncbi:MAG: hypothetical protein OXP68_04630 [Anaerolineaceae bacterium]|nr:hypothetical protein [Anaerolineaceae bacterium]
MGEDRGIRLFRKSGNHAHECEDKPFSTERELQAFFEANLYEFVGVHFLVSEYMTGPPHHSRIDTLGLDVDGRPVVVEYKRRSNENIINQGLYYLDWLRNNKARFRSLAHSKFDQRNVENIDFADAWLLCVAWEFTEWDYVAARESRRDIELWQYFRFDNDFVALIQMFPLPDNETKSSMDPMPAIPTSAEPETVTATHEVSPEERLVKRSESVSETNPEEVFEAEPDVIVATHNLDEYENFDFLRSDSERLSLFAALCECVEGLGSKVQTYVRKTYIAFGNLEGNRPRRLAIMKVYKRQAGLHVEVDVDEEFVEQAATEHPDIMYPAWQRNPGAFHYENLAIEIRSLDDLQKAQPYLQVAYNKMLTELALS